MRYDEAADPLEQMLTRLRLNAIRDQLDSLLDEAARRELNLRQALQLMCEREIARRTESPSIRRCVGPSSPRPCGEPMTPRSADAPGEAATPSEQP